jgi:hypothetical protein
MIQQRILASWITEKFLILKRVTDGSGQANGAADLVECDFYRCRMVSVAG